MAHAFGDVVPFPFTDQTGIKKRPAVVVSSREYNARRRDLIILAVTSQIRSPLGFCEALLADWRAAGLIKPCAFKPVVATIENSLVIRTLGGLAADDLKTLSSIVLKSIG